MCDFKWTLDRCHYVNRLSDMLVDQFLVYYADPQDKLAREFINRYSRFKDLEKLMPAIWPPFCTAQYTMVIAGRLNRS